MKRKRPDTKRLRKNRSSFNSGPKYSRRNYAKESVGKRSGGDFCVELDQWNGNRPDRQVFDKRRSDGVEWRSGGHQLGNEGSIGRSTWHRSSLFTEDH